MGIKIASLFAEISGDATKLERSLKDTKSKLQETSKEGVKTGHSLKSTFSSVAGVIGTAGGALGGFLIAFDKIMDFGKSGAMLEFAAGKFDRLSESAGTTADVLLKDLRAAVKGTRSDMELMGSAGDFMALGLAKSHDEVVRLTRVAGALNMDMNQLVLTLTNQTTMRFDALGVAVDGFEEKVKKLEATGMSTNEAFKEAFLQQAEDQINKVGDAADTNLGSFQRMESAFKNLGDTIKLKLIPPIADAADALTLLLTWSDKLNAVYDEQEVKLLESSKTYDEYSEGLLWAAKGAGKLNDVTSLNVEHILDQEDVLWRVMAALGGYSEATWGAATQTTDFADRLVDGRIGNELDNIETEADDVSGALDGMGAAAQDAKADILTLNDIDLSLADTIKRELDKIDFYLAGGLDLQQVTEDIRGAVLEGKITPEQADDLFADAYIAAQGLEVRMGEITADEAAQNVKDTLGVSLVDAKDKVTDVINEFAKIPSELRTELYVTVHYNDPGGPTAGDSDIIRQEKRLNQDLNGNGIIGAWGGASYIVPSGFYENYALPGGVAASSGERVDVTPVSQSGLKQDRGTTINLYNPVITTPVDYEMFLTQMVDDLRSRSR